MSRSMAFLKSATLNQMILNKIIHIEEPELIFGDNKKAIDPRDGLLLYGPHEKWGDKFKLNAHSVSAGVIGTKDALDKYKKFVDSIKQPIISKKRIQTGAIVSNELQRPSFPGFEAVFSINFPNEPEVFIEIKPLDFYGVFNKSTNRRMRTSNLVDFYLDKMMKASAGFDLRVNIWFVIVPKKIFDNCRSQKGFGTDFGKSTMKYFEDIEKGQQSLFSEEEMFGDEISKFFDTSSDFHHLLKARANQERLDAPIQIIVEPKLEFRDPEYMRFYSDDMKAFFAWSISTTLYYKLGKKPWKLATIRPGVCYLGLVFKKFQSKKNKHMVCSAAQLFMSDGDGTVFRGNNGLWQSENENEFHLNEEESFKLLDLALSDYHENNNNTYPTQLFIHGRAMFFDEEWDGFQKALKKHNAKTELVGIVIKDKAPLKFFRDVDGEKADYGVLRGIAAIIDDTEAFLFTRGFVPRMNSSLSMEIPNPLHVKVTRGAENIETVLRDIMALTKLNYNTCIHGDGKPVTLRFSDTIGNILTATENWKEERRQFIYYI